MGSRSGWQFPLPRYDCLELPEHPIHIAMYACEFQAPSACRCGQLSQALGLRASQSGRSFLLHSQPPHSKCCSAWHPVAHQVPLKQVPQQQQQTPWQPAPLTLLQSHSGQHRSGVLARQDAPLPAQAARLSCVLHIRCAAHAEPRQRGRALQIVHSNSSSHLVPQHQCRRWTNSSGRPA